MGLTLTQLLPIQVPMTFFGLNCSDIFTVALKERIVRSSLRTPLHQTMLLGGQQTLRGNFYIIYVNIRYFCF